MFILYLTGIILGGYNHEAPKPEEARKCLHRELDTSKLDIDTIAEESVRRLYSGREIANLCNLAIHHMLEEKNPELTDLNVLSEIDLKKLELKIRPLEMKDFEAAFKKIKSPLTRKEIKKYEEWAEKFGV